jgi:hypothetical protein
VPHPPQNFAAGFSGFPQLLQDEDVSSFFAGFLATYLFSYSSSSCLAGFGADVPLDPLFTAKTIPIIAAPIAAAPPAI